MLSAIFALLFGLSLLPGRKPLCLRFAERISDGIMPEGASEYCRKLSWVWFIVLILVTLSYSFTYYGAVAIPLLFIVEKQIRNRRFKVVFHTSGTSGKSKTIVKTFESLAKEVAFHRAYYKALLSKERTTILATIDAEHMYGTLWREMFPKAVGLNRPETTILTPEALIEKMQGANQVFLITTPSFLEKISAYAEDYAWPQNCVEIITSGALLTDEVSARAKQMFGIEPRQIFGSTETGGVAARRGGGNFEVFGPVKVSSYQGRLRVKSPFSFKRTYLMGDAVELSANNRSFKLLGRVDRLVKINETRINLSEMEQGIRALGFKDCALTVIKSKRGEAIGAVIVPKSDSSKLSPLEMRKLLLPLFPKGTVPRHYRIVSELPRNHQGKVVAAEIAKLFDTIIKPITFTGDEPYFKGHFPDFPLVPGVVQLGLAEQSARDLLITDAPLSLVKKLKFSNVIVPGDQVTLRVTKMDENTSSFEITKKESVCSSGVLEF